MESTAESVSPRTVTVSENSPSPWESVTVLFTGSTAVTYKGDVLAMPSPLRWPTV